MKKFLTYILLLCFLFVPFSAFAAKPSPNLLALYEVNNQHVNFAVLDSEDPSIDITMPFSILSDMGILSESVVNKLTLAEILSLNLSRKIGTVRFNFPTQFTMDQIIVNVFVYTKNNTDMATVVFGHATVNGGEYVNLNNLPMKTNVTMYVLYGSLEDIV